jgi:hypothetical protein
MDLPFKFPSETEVILEDVARFRALSPRERIRAIQGLLADGAYLMSISPKAEWARQRYALIGGLAFMVRGRPRFTQDVDRE